VLIELTNANTDAKVFVMSALVFYFYFSEANKCVHVVSNGGAFFPVKESLQQVEEKLCRPATTG